MEINSDRDVQEVDVEHHHQLETVIAKYRRQIRKEYNGMDIGKGLIATRLFCNMMGIYALLVEKILKHSQRLKFACTPFI